MLPDVTVEKNQKIIEVVELNQVNFQNLFQIVGEVLKQLTEDKCKSTVNDLSVCFK